MRLRCIQIPRVALGVLAALLLGGCQLPDVGPFVSDTAELKSAVAAGGAAVEQEVRLAFADGAQADALHANWQARNKAMTAMLRYAQSLDAIVAAGNAGSESAGKVADAVKGLAEAAGIAIPASPAAVAVATDTAKFLYGQIATIRAADQLAAALDEAQPAIERIAELMRQDLADASVVTKAADAIQATAIPTKYNKWLSDRKLITAAMGNLDPSKPTDRAEYTALSALLTTLEPRHTAYQQELRVLEERRSAALAVLDATGRALDEWAAAHADLASAARHKRPANTQSLITSATELRALVKRMREL